MPGMATVTIELRREEALQLRPSLLHPPVLKDAGGRRLDEPRASLLHPSVRGPIGEQSGENKTEGNRETQQETSDRKTSKEHPWLMRPGGGKVKIGRREIMLVGILKRIVNNLKKLNIPLYGWYKPLIKEQMIQRGYYQG